MVTTVTDNSPQAINTSLFSLEKEIEALKQNIERIKASLNNLDVGVVSVNDKTGKVELTAEDVGALPSDTHIPTDPVQSNWAETDTSSLAYIENKPNLATVATSGSYSDLSNKPTIPAAQVNSDWNATSGVEEILHKPTIPTATSQLTNDSEFATTTDITNAINGLPIIANSCSQVIYDNSDWIAPNTNQQILGAYDYSLFALPISIPSGYHAEYILSAQITTTDSIAVRVRLNNISTSYGGTWSWTAFRNNVVSGRFKASDIVLEPTMGATNPGTNLYFETNGGNGMAKVFYVMITCLAVKN